MVENRDGFILQDTFLSYSDFMETAARISKAAGKIPGTEGLAVQEKDPIQYLLQVYACLLAGRRVFLLYPGIGEKTRKNLLEKGVYFISENPDELKTLENDSCDINFSGKESFLEQCTGTLCFSTSGTESGRQRFIELPFEWMLKKSMLIAEILELSDGDQGIVFSPACFIQVFWTYLIHFIKDASVVVTAFNIQEIKNLADKNRVTSIVTTASVIRGFLRDPGFFDHFRELKRVICGGDHMDSETLRRLAAVRPDIKYANVYGCTETSAANIIHPPVLLGECDTDRVGIGYPAKYSAIKIKPMDADRGENRPGAVADGRVEFGEILCSTAYTPGHYLWNDESFLDEEYYFHTGDIASVMKDGSFIFEGRNSSFILYNGQKISGTEVELALRTLSSVRDACVIGREHDIFGQIAVAYVISDGVWNQKAVKEALRNKIEAYKIPKEIIFVKELPRTVSGKVNRSLIRNNDRDRSNGVKADI